ncbi:MAG: TIGR00725 family protein [Dehalococcoidales bacterium]|nr:TIGR00725 family protein [Dehalococcoidales bacterium]
MMKHRLFIGVVGDGDCGPAAAAVAQEVGRLLAEAGCSLVCGGLGGVMRAACQGALSAGGQTVGILPGDSAASANPFVAVPIVTGLGEARNVLVAKTSQAVIAVEGRYGTLSEIALALKLGRPVVGLNTWELARDGEADQRIVRAATPAEAVHLAIEMATRASGEGR